jgi:hypothetical protein
LSETQQESFHEGGRQNGARRARGASMPISVEIVAGAPPEVPRKGIPRGGLRPDTQELKDYLTPLQPDHTATTTGASKQRVKKVCGLLWPDELEQKKVTITKAPGDNRWYVYRKPITA